jgi:peptidyl-Lys metalloendopeptidase
MKNFRISWKYFVLLIILVLPTSILADTLVASLDSVDDNQLIVSFKLQNTSENQITFLKWNTPFDDDVFTTDMFQVYQGTGNRIEYTGKLLKRGPPSVADHYTLEPGESVSARVNIFQGYATYTEGVYQITFQSSIQLLTEHGEYNSIELISETLTAYQNTEYQSPVFKQVPQYTSCSVNQQEDINTALTYAEDMAIEAVQVLDSTPINDRPEAIRYTTWFGNYLSSRYVRLMSNFTTLRETIANETISFDCSCTENYYAYVFPNRPYIVYLCRSFWSADFSGTDSKAGTIIHELVHFDVVVGTNDNAYGQERSQALALNDPAAAINNSDNYEYFAENTPSLPMSGGSNGSSTWTTGAYGNNEDRSQQLSIAGASALIVTVTGETESNYDFLYIYDENGTEVMRLDGSINESFSVTGSSITARLVTDYSVTSSGVTVSVEEDSSSISSWTTGAYGNNEDRSQQLSIAGASALIVTVTGETESYFDFLYIYDENGTEVMRLDGSINESFSVTGSSITARLVTDDSVTSLGVTVGISEISVP